jgi:outer membrane protein with beta-barrel domain
MSNRSLIGRTLAVALGLAVLTASAAAQRDHAFEIGAFGGGYFGSQIYQGQIGGVGPIYNVGVNSAGLYGVRLGYDVSRQFGVEFSWSASNPSLNFNSWGAGAPTGSLSVNNFDFDAMFNFGQQRVWGYFALGMGWSMFDASVTVPSLGPPPTPSKSWFSGNTALGMKVFLNPHWALQFDARYRWSNTGHNTGTGTSCSIYYYCYSYSSTWYGASELSGGVTYVMFK